MSDGSAATPSCPPRPLVPVTLWVLAGVLVTETIALRWGAGAAPWMWGIACVLGLVLGCVCLLGTRHGIAATVGMTLVGCAAAVAVSWAEVASVGRAAEALSSRSVSTFSFEVASDASVSSSRWSSFWLCRAHVVEARDAGGDADCDAGEGGLVWLRVPQEVERGDVIRGVGHFEAAGTDDWGRSCHAQGIAGTVSVSHVSDCRQGEARPIESLRCQVLERIEPSSSGARALVAGLACGDRRELAAQGLDEEFATCGLSHLVAVSGGHLAVVAAIAGAALGHVGATPRLRWAILLCMSGCFVVFCGAPPSAVRAWAMSGVAAAGQLAGRRTHALSSVGVVALAMALLDPTLAGQLSFTLSVACVAGLSLLFPYARYAVGVTAPHPALPRRVARHVPRGVRRRLTKAYDGLWSSVAASLVAQAVTLPLTVGAFGSLSLVAPLASAAVTPLFTALMPLALLAALLSAAPWVFVPLPRSCALAACDVVAGALLSVVHRLSGLPLASVAVAMPSWAVAAPLVALVMLVLVRWPRVSRRVVRGLVCACVAVAVGLWARGRLLAPARLVVLDVGQGDAILVQDGASAVLVDTGPDEAVACALLRQGATHLDAVVLTHLHDDHYGGLAHLRGAVACDRVMVGAGVAEAALGGGDAAGVVATASELTGRAPEELGYGDSLAAGGFTLQVVSPTAPSDGTENEDSLELRVAYRDGDCQLTALLTGDGEAEVTRAVVDRGDVGDIDVLKVGHHGSAASTDAALAQALSPEVSVASAGEGNSYGHPSRECVDVLEDVGSLFLCTKDVGDVQLLPERGGVRVVTG